MGESVYGRFTVYFGGFSFEADNINEEHGVVTLDVWVHDVATLMVMCGCAWSAMLRIPGNDPFLAKPLTASFRHSNSTRFMFQRVDDAAIIEPARFGIDLDAILTAYTCVVTSSGVLSYGREEEFAFARRVIGASESLMNLRRVPRSFEDIVSELADSIRAQVDAVDALPDALASGW